MSLKLPLTEQDQREPLSVRAQREYVEAMRNRIGFSTERGSRYWLYFDLHAKRAYVYDAHAEETRIDLAVRDSLSWIDEARKAIAHRLLG